MKSNLNYIDLFAGAGGLSEGFIRAGFNPIAHVEMDSAACFTLKTRIAYHHLSENGKEDIYNSYLLGEISREDLYSKIPEQLMKSVINAEIGIENRETFKVIDSALDGRSVDLIIGGPPCQAYSVVGRAPLKHKSDDERTMLYVHYGRFLKKYQPKVFVFENVPGILSAANGKYFKNLQKYYRRLGYVVEQKLLNALDFGVVQSRERVIVIGWKKEIDFSYPEFCLEELRGYRDDIFSDLPKIFPGEVSRTQQYSSAINTYLKQTEIRNGVNYVTQHITRPHNDKDLAIYRLAIERMNAGERLKNNLIPEEMRTQKNTKDFLDRFKVVDKTPHTMIAHIAKDGHHFIHPDVNQLRSISVREAARIQSFPDSYYFEGIKEKSPRSAAFRQIGNAVPPLMAEKIAEQIKNLLDNA
ncbi:DNA cytosine methyltransferase [Algoriphagus yeomjeoni]|uniref:DNA cytosine methyltransferase n=1 Tax=Algoriphagus yeomjeoni TaxID=291403 RepID=UPI003CE4BBAB